MQLLAMKKLNLKKLPPKHILLFISKKQISTTVKAVGLQIIDSICR